MAEDAARTRVYLPGCALTQGVIEEAWGRIDGDCCIVHVGLTVRATPGEGTNWHRRRWAAENYARQIQAARLDHLRAEITRIEGYRFGRLGS